MVGSSLGDCKSDCKSTKKRAAAKNQSTRPAVLDRQGARKARRPDAAMRARLTLGGRRRRGDRTPRWPEKAKTKEAGPICARPPRAARGVAGQGAELRVVRKQRRVPRPERATTPITMRPTTMRLRPPAPGDAAKAERKAGVKRARAHARFGTAPLRVRVAARQARVGRLPHVRATVSVTYTFRAPSRTAWTQSLRRAQARPPRTSSTAQRVVTARMDGPLDLRAKELKK